MTYCDRFRQPDKRGTGEITPKNPFDSPAFRIAPAFDFFFDVSPANKLLPLWFLQVSKGMVSLLRPADREPPPAVRLE
jgi:hypothetical protein